MTAVSRTLRLMTPSVAMPAQPSPASGPSGSRARDALNPKRPHEAAGMRIDPPPSDPCAIGTIPAATAAAAPPDDPPAVRSRSQGLRVGPPWTAASVAGPMPPSGAVVRAKRTTPVARIRTTSSLSWS